MTKRFIFCAIAGILAGTAFLGSPARAQISLNGQQVSYSVRPFTIGNFLMVPLRQTLTTLGVNQMTWNPAAMQAEFTYRANNVVIRTGSGYAVVNGEDVVMGVPAVERNGTLFVPLSFMRRQLGVNVTVASGYVRPGVRAIVLGLRQPSVVMEHPGSIGIGGINVIELPTAGEFSSLDARATRVTTNLTSGLQQAMQLDNGAVRTQRVTLGCLNDLPTIYIAGVPLVSVTQADADATGMDINRLSRAWLALVRGNLRRIYGR